jgi:hypothetical protein
MADFTTDELREARRAILSLQGKSVKASGKQTLWLPKLTASR